MGELSLVFLHICGLISVSVLPMPSGKYKIMFLKKKEFKD
jgi:hypothetical protein